MNENSLLNLKGKRISAIVFVLDYLQIQFDDSILSFLVYPKIQINNETFSFGESEYRNKICEFIGNDVSTVKYIEDDLFCLSFNDAKIYCLLNPENYTLPEMIIYDDGQGSIIVI